MIRVGLIGFGFVGKTFHLAYLEALPEQYEVTILGTRSADALQQLKNKNAKRLEDYEAVCGSADVDLVVIASPNTTHYTLSKKALLANKHVVCDKPFVLELAEVRELLQLSQSQQRLLSVFQNRRWDSCFRAVQEALRTGELGEPRLFYFNWERFRLEVRDRWREQNLAGSGIWYDLGSHMLDQVVCLFGLPCAITTHLAKQRSGAQIDDFAHAVLEYEGPLRVVLTMSMCARPELSRRYTLHGTKGSIVKSNIDIEEDHLKASMSPLDPAFGVDPEQAQCLANGDKVQTKPVPKGNQLEYYREVARAIESHKIQTIPHPHILAVVALLKAGFLSNESSRRIAMTEILRPEEIEQIKRECV
eukprot:Gregarina_sp_Pseudo_9__1663@NODE_211_length_3603_cov_39_818743_g196_i0_p2_GENE_NODE_211_length_3603_cov_39_818743_g196_i0NODE_211_length_3603_cov_39_818743_g196_i0_p2_ORF_typecomplete_len361_score105_82GFO_IDH_MocA/PF01408_22/4_9e26GFO_IDH_MocA/PF01408_22/1_7e03GFO_IDH_MocA_C/PF02894_17/4_4e14NAD_binding_3/PF03447_16/9_7e05NAD_binding_2/PF03446_15/0_0015DapB_N/PF01113_20/0_0048F420_oxidored/PF03807_17/0_013Rossmannlike/PF10727_9/0_039Semialdhyde_dh/PF01118_24/0_12MYO10_CC/PF16735_5/3_1MYO10_CC/P